MKLRTTWTTLLLMMALTGLSARAEVGDGPIAALPWLHERLQLTYTWQATVVPGTEHDFEEVTDPHGQAHWVSKSTGAPLERTVRQGTSGSGLSELNVTCIDGDQVVLSQQDFGDAGAQNNHAMLLLPQTPGSMLPANDVSGYWMDPAKLATLRTDAQQGIVVAALSWKSGDKMVDAISVESYGNSYSLSVFDAKTGICLHNATISRGQAPRIVGPGDAGLGDVTLTRTDYVGRRDLAIPWAQEAIPDAAMTFKALHFRGSNISRGPLPTVPNVVTMDLTPLHRGHGWIEVTQTTSQRIQGAPQSPASTEKLVCGRGQFGSLWAGPTALAALREKQVLDEDPLTKVKTFVAKVNKNSVEIVSFNAAGGVDTEYDKQTGLATSISILNRVSGYELKMQLQARE